MNMNLKVKICTLAAESKIIRTQQRNLLKRVKDVTVRDVINMGLKIDFKAKSEPLTEEEKIGFRILRLEKKKHKAKLAVIRMGQKPLDLWPSLQRHRRVVVRREARVSLLAYAFLRNRAYIQLEHKCHEEPNWKEVERIIKRFTTAIDQRIVLQHFEEWRQRGREDQDKLKGEQKAA